MSFRYAVAVLLAVIAIASRFHSFKGPVFELDCTNLDKVYKLYSPCEEGYRSLYLEGTREKTGFVIACDNFIFDAFNFSTCLYKNASNSGTFGFLGGVVMLLGNAIFLGFLPSSIVTRMFACLVMTLQISGGLLAPKTIVLLTLTLTFTADIIRTILRNWPHYLQNRFNSRLRTAQSTQIPTQRSMT
jgi:hypothetical protein